MHVRGIMNLSRSCYSVIAELIYSLSENTDELLHSSTLASRSSERLNPCCVAYPHSILISLHLAINFKNDNQTHINFFYVSTCLSREDAFYLPKSNQSRIEG